MRLIAILIVFGLAIGAGGCASRTKKPRREEAPEPQEVETTKPRKAVLLPRQTGSNLDRRIVADDESDVQETKKKSKPPLKKQVKTERTEPDRADPEKPKKSEEPEQTTTAPDRFR